MLSEIDIIIASDAIGKHLNKPDVVKAADVYQE